MLSLIDEPNQITMSIDPQQTVAKTLKNGRMRLSASQMNRIITECTHPIQIEIRNPADQSGQHHIDVLSGLMARDQWLDDDQLTFGSVGGRVYILDGNHRAHAQVKTGKTINWSIRLIECANDDHFRSLFYKFNTNTRSRTTQQILGVVGFAEDCNLTRQMASALYRAVEVIHHKFSFDRKERDIVFMRTPDLRISAAKQWMKQARLYDAAVASAVPQMKSKLFLSTVTAVALVTIKYHPDAAIEFWSGVANDDGLRSGDPRKALHADLRTRHMSSGCVGQGAIVSALAWNAFYSNEPRRSLRVGENAKVIINGTPFGGRAR
jgi:hypothetical protein